MRLTQKFKMPAKNGGKWFWVKLASRLSRYDGGQKFYQNHSFLHSFQNRCVFWFYAEIQDGHKKWRENDFWEKSTVDPADSLWVKYFVEIALSHTVSEINVFLCFTQKFKMAIKNGR